MNPSEISSFLWGVADLIRDTFKRGKYQDVILPLTVLRRLDCVLAETRDKVLERYHALKGKLDNLDPQLRKASGYAFYNTSKFTFELLLNDQAHLAANLRKWIDGFSPNMRNVLERFEFDDTIRKLDSAGLLYLVLDRFKSVDLGPKALDNFAMGTVFEELIRKFNEALNENPGEHFTPREVIQLMVELMIAPDRAALSKPNVVRTVYDPCCGTGGMLTITRDTIRSTTKNAGADIHLFGQEVNPETWAVCASDFFLKTETGRDAENVAYGSCLAKDGHAGITFDYLITNPPYGKDWKMDEEAVEAEAGLGAAGRFPAGTPRISDGQLLFLQLLVSHMKPAAQGGSRAAIIMNGSPLFTGDAGSGESEIRRWLMERDLVDAIIALPEQLFYNTGIATYIWLLSNRKSKERRGKVQLIDASGEAYWQPMRKSLGDKRRQIGDEQRRRVVELYEAFAESEHVKIFETSAFGFRKITVERPLRLNFHATPERIARLEEMRAFANLAVSKKKSATERAKDEKAGRAEQEVTRAVVAALPKTPFKDRTAFLAALDRAAKGAGTKLSASIRAAIVDALSERDESAAICVDAHGKPEPDSELRDTESVPLSETIESFFDREVKPHVPDAWIDTSKRDEKDGKVGAVGYEINFNRYFYRYVPPRPLEEIQADIRAIENDILRMLAEVTGSGESGGAA